MQHIISQIKGELMKLGYLIRISLLPLMRTCKKKKGELNSQAMVK